MTPYTLPYDCARCAPELPGKQCESCLRWDKMPNQTYGPRTATTLGVEGPGTVGCSYSPKRQERDAST